VPIRIPDDLPAVAALESENIFVMREERAVHQDIRPLRIAILNLMPTKVETEIQILRLLSNSPLQTDITFLQMASHRSKNTSQEYLDRFYRRFDDIRGEKFDGLIVTGAPVENLEFEQVDYWDELCGIMDWSLTNACSSLYICWGAQAGLYHHYGIPKYPLEKKMSGIFEHRTVVRDDPLFRGFDDVFHMPHSRHTEIRSSDVHRNPHLHVIAESEAAGAGVVVSERSQVFVTGHFEYDGGRLAFEYERDSKKGMSPEMPANYFPDDDPRRDPVVNWRAHATLLFTNWLNYFVYQRTPYDLDDIGRPGAEG
jgi:homoserine O-succinyltransferase